MHPFLSCRCLTFSSARMPGSWAGNSPLRTEAGSIPTSLPSLSKCRHDVAGFRIGEPTGLKACATPSPCACARPKGVTTIRITAPARNRRSVRHGFVLISSCRFLLEPLSLSVKYRLIHHGLPGRLGMGIRGYSCRGVFWEGSMPTRRARSEVNRPSGSSRRLISRRSR